MSLLLDALKQAEQSKKQAGQEDHDGLNPLSAPIQPTSDDNDSGLVELALTTDFDLTDNSQLQTTPENLLELKTAETDKKTSETPDETLETTVEPLKEKQESSEIIADSPIPTPQKIEEVSAISDAEASQQQPSVSSQKSAINPHPPSVKTTPEEFQQQDMEAAKSILQVASVANKKTAWWLGILLLLLIALAGGMFMLLNTPESQFQQSNATASAFNVPDADAGLTVMPDPNETNNTDTVKQENPALTVMAKAPTQTHINKAPVAQKENTALSQPAADFYVEDSSQKAATPIKITIKKQPSNITKKLLQAYSAYRQHNFSLAKKWYIQILKQDPRNTDALLGLGSIAEQQGKRAAAINIYRQALRLDAHQAFAQRAMIRLQQNTKPSEKQALYQQMIKNNPDNAQNYAALADFYMRQHRWRKAQELYFKAVERQPENAVYQYNLAVSLDHLSKPNSALPYYRKALILSRHPKSAIDRIAVEKRIAQLLENK